MSNDPKVLFQWQAKAEHRPHVLPVIFLVLINCCTAVTSVHVRSCFAKVASVHCLSIRRTAETALVCKSMTRSLDETCPTSMFAAMQIVQRGAAGPVRAHLQACHRARSTGPDALYLDDKHIQTDGKGRYNTGRRCCCARLARNLRTTDGIVVNSYCHEA